jgi:peptidoglycan hydrolase-like protein with peptidoglycan-binding domain
MIESYAYLHLALDSEVSPELQPPFNSLNWKKLSTHAYSCFLSLAVILAVVSVADTAQALLTVGDAGSQVQQVQQRLREMGYFHAHTTGYYGPITHHAVLQFQRDHGLPADGIVGHETLSALKLGSRPHPQPHPKPNPAYHPITHDRHLIGLGVGDQGPGVKDLQKRLKELGFFHAHTTGYFGSITRHAVIEFQQHYEIAATGLVTEETLAALNARDKDPGYDHSTARGKDQGYGYPTARGKDRKPHHPTAILLPARFLSIGDVGATVRLLQQRLQALGYYHGLITEVYDEETAEAVREFQITHGIEPTGMVGPTTLGYIEDQLKTASVPYPSQQQYLQRKLRSQGHPNPRWQDKQDFSHPQRQVHPQTDEKTQPTHTVDISTWYEQTQVKPRLQSTSLPRRYVPAHPHPLRVTDTYLELGDVGTAVRAVQRQLRQLNFYNGPINGFYDPLTEQAVIRFQRANRLTQTGVVGPTTQTYLFHAKSPSIPPEEKEKETETETDTSSSNPFYQSVSRPPRTAHPNIPTASIKALQERLSIQGLYNGPIDGVYNDQTRIAVTSARQLYGPSMDEILFGKL